MWQADYNCKKKNQEFLFSQTKTICYIKYKSPKISSSNNPFAQRSIDFQNKKKVSKPQNNW